LPLQNLDVKFDSLKHHRRSIRLRDNDYTQTGAYFVTMVAQDRVGLFGDVIAGEMRLNDAGQMLSAQWNELPQRFPNIELDEFIVMPNHIHGIIVITDTHRATTRVAPTPDVSVGAPLVGAQSDDDKNYDPALGNIVGAWKSITTYEYIRGMRELHWESFHRQLWQRNYWEHIIRNEKDLERIRAYIANNPANWDADDENPRRVR
jgi:putative transposase